MIEGDGLAAFTASVDRIPDGYGEGSFDDRRYGVTLDASADRRRRWLYAEELGGTDRISFNLFALSDGRLALRPCEMPEAKVVDFVLGMCLSADARLSLCLQKMR
jgi:hypothetical protein